LDYFFGMYPLENRHPTPFLKHNTYRVFKEENSAVYLFSPGTCETKAGELLEPREKPEIQYKSKIK
jgi:hypothetical protein